MYHFDLPQPVQDLGGWTNPVLADYFEDYDRVLYTNFGDKVNFVICDLGLLLRCKTGLCFSGNLRSLDLQLAKNILDQNFSPILQVCSRLPSFFNNELTSCP
jgi:hypothetical protein